MSTSKANTPSTRESVYSTWMNLKNLSKGTIQRSEPPPFRCLSIYCKINKINFHLRSRDQRHDIQHRRCFRDSRAGCLYIRTAALPEASAMGRTPGRCRLPDETQIQCPDAHLVYGSRDTRRQYNSKHPRDSCAHHGQSGRTIRVLCKGA